MADSKSLASAPMLLSVIPPSSHGVNLDLNLLTNIPLASVGLQFSGVFSLTVDEHRSFAVRENQYVAHSGHQPDGEPRSEKAECRQSPLLGR